MKKKKEWYQERWVIILFVIIGLVVIWNYSGIFNNQKGNWLEEQGYEVLEFRSYNYSGENIASVEMKSLGNRHDQVMKGLISLESSYPRMDNYYVSIIEERRSCFYSIEGVIFSPYIESLREEVVIDSNKVEETFTYLIWSGYAKPEYEKYLNGEEYDYSLGSSYERLLQTGIDKSHLSSMITFMIDSPANCE